MHTYSLQKLVELAKRKSPFYQNLYKKIDVSNFQLSDLPIIDERAFWDANSYHNNQIITDPLMHGILLRSGGTAGAPKTSVFSSSEWRMLCKIISSKLHEEGLLKAGDCVANMFVYGSLYGSFLLINDMLLECPFQVIELPIGIGEELDIKNSVELIKELKANVIMGTPLLLVSIVHYIKSHQIKGVKLSRFLYGSDLLLESQYRFIKEAFPNATISSSTYASTDSGFLGYADATCQINEYRTDDRFTIMEIVDEQGYVIEEENTIGRLIITNLTKTQMPVIRYPAGDLAIWCEPKECNFRRLKLVGRQKTKDNLVTLGDKQLTYDDLYEILKKSKMCGNILGFQVRINKEITIQIASDIVEEGVLQAAKSEIRLLIAETIPEANMDVIKIEFKPFADLKFTARAKIIKFIKE